MSRATQRSLALVVGVVVAFVVLEGFLQVTAFVVWRSAREGGAVTPDGRATILCVGDSFTYGLGATEQADAYPTRLLVALEEHDEGEFAVVNRGWPGRDSRELLASLDTPLEQLQPRYVCILIGTNDRWSRPDRLATDEVSARVESFPWRFRTGRLLRLITSRREQEARDDANAERLCGRWHGWPFDFTLEADGRVVGGGAWQTWSVSTDRLEVVSNDDQVHSISWRIDGDTLTLQTALRPTPFLLTRGAPRTRDDGDDLSRRATSVVDALQTGDLGAAHTAMNLLRDHPPADADQGVIVRLLGATRTAGDPDLEIAGLTWVLSGLPRHDSALIAADRLAATEASARIVADAVQTMTARARLAPADRAFLIRLVARLRHATDATAALRAAYDAFAIDGDREATMLLLRTCGRVFTADVRVAALEDVAAPSPTREFRELLVESDRPVSDVSSVLEDHLRRMVERCRAVGATPILLTYPDRIDPVETAMAAVAAGEGVEWIDVAAAFEPLMRERPREELFVPDDHLTSAGYDELGRIVAARILELDS